MRNKYNKYWFSFSYINFTDLTQMVTEFVDMAKSFGNAELNNLAKKDPRGA